MRRQGTASQPPENEDLIRDSENENNEIVAEDISDGR